MLDARSRKKIDLLLYSKSLELYFCIISHSSSKHQLSLSESADTEIDILPSKANLVTANLNLVSKWISGVMLGWWFTGKGVILIRLSQAENTLEAGVVHGELDIISSKFCNYFRIKDPLNMKSFYRLNIPRLKKKCSGFQLKKKSKIPKFKAMGFLIQTYSYIFT